MRKLWLIPIGFAALLVPVVVLAGSGEGGFDGVVQSIESKYHVHATRIPFLGLISILSRRATHDGVSGMHIAEFEDFHQLVDGEELNAMVEQKLGQGWERIIRETSRKSSSKGTGSGGSEENCDNQTLIFMHPEGQKMGLFILDLDGKELDVVQVSVDPDHLTQSLDKYNHHSHNNDDSDKPTRDDSESD